MESIKKNFLFNSLSSILSIVVPLITTPYITRILGPEILGEYSYNYSIATYFVTVALLGLNNYGNRSIAAIRDHSERLSGEFCSIYGMQLGIGLLVSAVYIGYAVFTDNLACWMLLPYVFSAAVSVNWFFCGMELFRLIVPRNVIIKLLTTVCVFIFVKDAADMWKYACIISLGSFISELALWPYIRRYIHICIPTWKEIIVHIRPNMILFIPVLAITIYKLMDKVMLGILASKTEVGYYEAAEKLIQIPNALVVSLGTIMLPRMSNLFAKHEESRIMLYIKKSLIVSMLISVPMSFGIMATAKELVPIFFGSGYEKCVILIQYILPGCIFAAFANVVRTLYLIPKQMDGIYIRSVWLGAVINLILNIALIPSLMSVGAAIGTMFAEASVCIYQILATRRKLQIRSAMKSVFLILLYGIIMYLVVYHMNGPQNSLFVSLITKVFLGIVIFGGLLGVSYVYQCFQSTRRKDGD